MIRVLCLVLLLLMPLNAKAETALQRLESYLNSMSTMASEFIQVAPDGTVSDGMFFLSRPGKLRWQYNAPVPILIVANDDTLTYYDRELDQISYVDIEDHLAAVLAQKRIDFREDVIVERSKVFDDEVSVTLRSKAAPKEGTITLFFARSPTLLKKLRITDINGNETLVTFTNPEFGMALDDELFIVKNPRIFNRKMRN